MRTICTIVFLLVFHDIPTFAQAVRVTGTSVTMAPPSGFTAAQRFPGFERPDLQSSIMVTELPAPADGLTRGMNAAGLASRGMTLISSSRPQIDGTPALLLHVSQTASGTLFLKWMLVVGDTKSSVMIVGTFPKSLEAQLSEPMKAAVLSTRWRLSAAPNPNEGLPFKVTGTPALKIAGRVSNMLMLTESGKLGPQGPDSALLAIGSSVAAIRIDDLKTFSEERARQTKQLKEITVSRGTSITIDGNAAYELVADGTDVATGKAVTLYQVIMPRSGGYVLMQGMVTTVRANAMVPEFRRVAATFQGADRPRPGPVAWQGRGITGGGEVIPSGAI